MSRGRYVQVRLSEEDADWFDRNFKMVTKQAFVEQCFRYLRKAVDEGHLPTPEVYPKTAAILSILNLSPDGDTRGL